MFTLLGSANRFSRLLAGAVLLLSLLVTTPVESAASGTTHDVANLSQWNAAVRAARPGDTIRLTATINAPLQYRGNNDGRGTQTGQPGTAAAPITITAAPGVWIDPGNRSNLIGALDIVFVDHVHVNGVRVRNSQFGIRFIQTRGTSAAPVRITNNVVEDIGHAGIHFGGHLGNHAPSRFGLIAGNTVRRTGLNAAHFGEGVYLGHGGTEWVDETSDVVVRDNHISYTGAEAVDIKPGTRNVVVENNRIHDLSPISGGAISAHYVSVDANPKPAELDYVLIRNNDIWNINLDGRAGSNDWPIWVGHGGVDIVGNRIWGLRSDPNRARAIRIRAIRDFGPHPIRITDNVFWTATGWMAEGSPSGASNVVASGNLGFASGGGTQRVAASHFVGPVPSIGSGGTADAGSGPGSGFRLAGSAPSTSTTTAPPTTAAPRATSTTTAPRATSSTTASPTTAVPTTAAPRATSSTTASPTTAVSTTAAESSSSLPGTAEPTPSGTRPASSVDIGPDATPSNSAPSIPGSAAVDDTQPEPLSAGVADPERREGETSDRRVVESVDDDSIDPAEGSIGGIEAADNQREVGQPEQEQNSLSADSSSLEPSASPPAVLAFDDDVAMVDIVEDGGGGGLQSLILLLLGGGILTFAAASLFGRVREGWERRSL